MSPQLPETTVRYRLLHATRRWVGLNYEPGDHHSEAGERALRTVLGLPPGAFVRGDFPTGRFEHAVHAFGELTHMAIWCDKHDGFDDPDLALASQVYAGIPEGTTWLQDEARTCEVMTSMVLAWCMAAGLEQAMSDLDAIDCLDVSGLLP